MSSLRQLADHAFSRAAGAPLVGGNRVDVLRDARENYPAWDAAIAAARSTIHVDMYIIHRDDVGRRFVAALAKRARAGVQVRLIYDWFGCGSGPLFGVFRPLVEAGGQVRAFNPPSLATLLGWARRDHRKLIVVDGDVAFVSGLCVGRMWAGRPEKKLEPWRDTGVSIRGPAVAHAEKTFAESWRLTGGNPDEIRVPDEKDLPHAGDVSLRLIPTEPFAGNTLRVDLLVAAMARKRLWITDAYFLGHGPFVEALRHAAGDGVDVRLLLPQGSDVGWTVPASRTVYRTLIESGVRIFEWCGTMIHAKTAVADSRWARIGSTNLNINSWLGNWELDVAIEDEGIARTLEAHYEEDLANASEVVIGGPARNMVGLPASAVRLRRYRSARRVVREVTGLGRSLGAAVTGNRKLDNYEVGPLVVVGALLLVLGALGIWQPRALAWPAAGLLVWTGVSFLYESTQIWRKRQRPS